MIWDFSYLFKICDNSCPHLLTVNIFLKNRSSDIIQSVNGYMLKFLQSHEKCMIVWNGFHISFCDELFQTFKDKTWLDYLKFKSILVSNNDFIPSDKSERTNVLYNSENKANLVNVANDHIHSCELQWYCWHVGIAARASHVTLSYIVIRESRDVL